MPNRIADSCRVQHAQVHEDGDGASESSACHPEPDSEPEPSNNLAELTPEIVCVEKLGMFLLKHGTVHHYLAFSIGLSYPSYVLRVFQ